jgi:glutathione S-transferase
MSLTLDFHPLSSFCQKVLVALYENDTPFHPHLVDLGDAAARAAFLALWPLGKFPVLRDDARNETIPESSIVIEYLAQHYPGRTKLIPDGPELARQTRLQDRFYDLYLQDPMQKIVGDRRRPPESRDPYGVAQARERLDTAYDMIEADMGGKMWATGADFSMADCAAAPALFYANLVQPFGPRHGNLAAYFERLMQRPSFARVVQEAKPYFHMFPK